MIGKWNKSVILTYVGLLSSILGVVLVIFSIDIKYAFICLMVSGICDLFDGTVARMCKRTKEEKEFGIELDSLVDVSSFIALPLALLAKINSNWYVIPIALIYALFATARLAYFNIKTADKDKAVSYYIGFPVTYAALVFPLLYLFLYFFLNSLLPLIFSIAILFVAILYIVRVKVPKPNLISSIILIPVGIIATCIYIFVV